MVLYTAIAFELLGLASGPVPSRISTSTKLVWFPPRTLPVPGIDVNLDRKLVREAISAAVLADMMDRPCEDMADNAREAVGTEMLYGALAFVMICIKDGEARR